MAANLLTSQVLFTLLCLSSVRAGFGNHFCRGTSDGRCCETRCPEGWIGYKGQCYLFQHATRTFYQAKVDCENSYGSHLVKADNEAENNWIELQLPALSNACRYPGAVLFENPNLGKSICYWKAPDTSVDYTAGQESCRSTGGDLAYVPDVETFNFLKLQYTTDVYDGIWIGVTVDDTTGNYVDAEGNTQIYLPWATDEPDGGQLKCVDIYRDEFYDFQCTAQQPALCSLTLHENKGYWIGATDEKTEGTFQWILDGEDVGGFSDFGSPQPDGTTDENCVMFTDISGSHSWADEACSSKNGFICEKDADCF